MKLLVTGLCLSRNLGGPAMALTLVDQLQRRLQEKPEFVFAVTPNSFDEESYWANRYGLKIVRRDSVLQWWTYNKFPLQVARKIKRLVSQSKVSNHQTQNLQDVNEIHREFMDAFQRADLVIDMMGIAYVGDGVRGAFEGINSYSSYYYAKQHGKRIARFIQSFGPFDDWRVRIFARSEFKRLPFIPARGRHSAAYCKEIVKDQSKVYDFPDCAVLLPRDDVWAQKFLDENQLSAKNFVIVSPSSVIYRTVKKTAGGSVGDKHIDSMVLICKRLLDQGETIVFLPHMYSRNPNECDRHVARLISSELSQEDIVIVEENLDPMMAKGLISKSKYSIVSRYHALVAALSSGINVITIGWNIKYHDMMEYYGKEKYAVDMRRYEPHDLADRVLCLAEDFSLSEEQKYLEIFKQRQVEVETKVYQAFDMLASWIENGN